MFSLRALVLVGVDSAVKYQMKLYGDDLKERDVIMTNSPHAGGSQVLSVLHSLRHFSFLAADTSRTSP
jgi:N-methylhydantoinase B/oxoprolinase/acetone carboxylase alpha subunit